MRTEEAASFNAYTLFTTYLLKLSLRDLVRGCTDSRLLVSWCLGIILLLGVDAWWLPWLCCGVGARRGSENRA